MFDATFEKVLHACEGTLLDSLAPNISDIKDAAITAVVTDNRAVVGGELFVAIKGERSNGNSFGADALNRGAVAVLSDDPDTALAAGVAPERLICVNDVVKALGMLARESLRQLRHNGNPDLKVVGITGSVGKTTTKDLLAQMLAYRGAIVAPPNSFNNEIGVPLTVLRADKQTATLVLEMGADHIGNIEYLTSIASPDISAVLAVARAHLGEFGGIENVARAKSELVTGTQADGQVVLNADDGRVVAMEELSSVPVTFFSATGAKTITNSKADVLVYASDITNCEGHAQFVLHIGEQQERVRMALAGLHHVNNALAAGAVAHLLNVPIEHIAQVLQQANAASPHRMDVRRIGEITVIDDSYNANPDSMRAGLRALADLGANRRKIAVLGTMLELGAESDTEHRHIGEYLAQLGVDVAFCIGEGTSKLAQAAELGGVNVRQFSTVDSAQEFLRSELRAGDVVLLKGSNGSGVWKIADELLTEGE
ncbi:UDP-N-acetylmuramoyl-tripeptide--D-alanyl-D-alanine ligase [Arcanobacterium pluranimalium]|uniref:UDP-N-acetylmuramoyl-tripeptide--D-alanyl-D- alanine ligase n=1 Tax=Arcanobacterium pluranimalium TaxID=108028 RepID=UPI001959393B|nr:UDP-N-acetylmuramoyl-tripeptide--D-alanyl-D-alanine ligase [Arcanobacterium pluranimalium]MBM7825598.1 UDP-N-acetylmuramoyl-tripeptide--D-alanyl-D-alanine ligase [Arcanobacterium pluranimalium]